MDDVEREAVDSRAPQERAAEPQAEPSTHLTVRRVYEPDDRRCVAAVVLLLAAGARARAERSCDGHPADDFEERDG